MKSIRIQYEPGSGFSPPRLFIESDKVEGVGELKAVLQRALAACEQQEANPAPLGEQHLITATIALPKGVL